MTLLLAGMSFAAEDEQPRTIDYPFYPPAPEKQDQGAANLKSAGCVSCHTSSDAKTMHASPAVVLGCTDCHGGAASVMRPDGIDSGADYNAARERAHVQPRYPESWHYPSSANPERSYTLLNRESAEFTRFVNPSDYRVATEACGACHQPVLVAYHLRGGYNLHSSISEPLKEWIHVLAVRPTIRQVNPLNMHL